MADCCDIDPLVFGHCAPDCPATMWTPAAINEHDTDCRRRAIEIQLYCYSPDSTPWRVLEAACGPTQTVRQRLHCTRWTARTLRKEAAHAQPA